MFPSEQLSNIFEGAIEAAAEAIINSMCLTKTISGKNEVPLDKLAGILEPLQNK